MASNENVKTVIECDESKTKEIKLYKKRWYILTLYVVYMMCNSSQWLQYSIVTSATARYYNVTNWHVNLTSLVMMGCYLPLALPAANLMNRINLRWTAILGSFGTAAGSWIKVFSASPERFHVTLAGQTVVAVSQVLMLSVPQKLSSVWFGEKEVSTACSIGVFGFQLGIVIGFFVPPILVKNHPQISDIGDDFYRMFLIFAIFSSVVAALVFMTFQSAPVSPPTKAASQCNSKESSGYLLTLRRLFTSRHLVGLFITTGVNNGCFNGFSTLLSQILLEYFPETEESGMIGVTLVIFGMIGSVSFGYILDRTKKFKLILISMYYMSAVGMTIFIILLMNVRVITPMYFAAGFLGTFLCGFTAISFDVATELTYPESELIVGTIMNMMSLLFTFATTLFFGYMNETLGFFWGNVGFASALFVGATSTLPIKFELKRLAAQRAKSNAVEAEKLVNGDKDYVCS